MYRKHSVNSGISFENDGLLMVAEMRGEDGKGTLSILKTSKYSSAKDVETNRFTARNSVYPKNILWCWMVCGRSLKIDSCGNCSLQRDKSSSIIYMIKVSSSDSKVHYIFSLGDLMHSSVLEDTFIESFHKLVSEAF